MFRNELNKKLGVVGLGTVLGQVSTIVVMPVLNQTLFSFGVFCMGNVVKRGGSVFVRFYVKVRIGLDATKKS